MVNKMNGEKISTQDLTEFDALMPALGEVFKTAEDIRHFGNISCGVHAHLIDCKD